MSKKNKFVKLTGFAEIVSLVSVPVILVICTFGDFPDKTVLMYLTVILSLVPFFAAYEKEKKSSYSLMPIVILSAFSAVGRILFAALPNFKPVTAIVIIAGAALGAPSGFICGAFSALASNIFFGQGAWTVWQMFAWGLIGYLSGVFVKYGIVRGRLSACVWSFFACIIYGIILDTWSIAGFVSAQSVKSVLTVYISGIPFTLIHAISSVIFIFVLYNPWCRIIKRIKDKYSI